MYERFSVSMTMVAIAAAAIISGSLGPTAAQVQAPSATAPAPALKTPWGEPDLQGIWTDEFDTPFQRPAKYANQEFFTEAQRAELDEERSALLGRRATERELAGAYNLAVFLSTKRTGVRTSRIVDPPDGRIPMLTAEAQKAAAADREFRLALLRATDTCKTEIAQCRGGKYNPTPSPRRYCPISRTSADSSPLPTDRSRTPIGGALLHALASPGRQGRAASGACAVATAFSSMLR